MTAKELRQYFGRYEHLGTHVISESGTELIGKAPHIGNCAWLFEIFSPITDNELSEMEAKLECAIPTHIRRWCKRDGFCCNIRKVGNRLLGSFNIGGRQI